MIDLFGFKIHSAFAPFISMIGAGVIMKIAYVVNDLYKILILKEKIKMDERYVITVMNYYTYEHVNSIRVLLEKLEGVELVDDFKDDEGTHFVINVEDEEVKGVLESLDSSDVFSLHEDYSNQ